MKLPKTRKKYCPKCKKHDLKKQISGGAFILKGTGWYRDGYGNKYPKKET